MYTPQRKFKPHWPLTSITPSTKKKKDWASSPPPHSVLLWWLPSFLWACRDLLDIPLIYGSYIICSNIVHRATACLLVSLSVVITQFEGRVEDWARGMEAWYMYDRWIRHSIDEWTVSMWGHQLLQITCMHLYAPMYAFECALQIMRGWVSLCGTAGTSVDKVEIMAFQCVRVDSTVRKNRDGQEMFGCPGESVARDSSQEEYCWGGWRGSRGITLGVSGMCVCLRKCEEKEEGALRRFGRMNLSLKVEKSWVTKMKRKCCCVAGL